MQDQLGRILVAASVGLSVSPSTCAIASEHALLLAAGLGSPKWVNYVVKLHLQARLAMEAHVACLFERAICRCPGADSSLFEEYLQMLEHSELSDDGRRLWLKLSTFRP